MSKKSLPISILFLCLMYSHLSSQVLTNTLYGETENNQLGLHLSTSEDGNRFAYTSREFVNDSIYHDVVNIFDNQNGILTQVGNTINCSLNFEDTLVSRRLKFDMSADGETLIFFVDSVYFSYSYNFDDWELKDKISFQLKEYDFVSNFSLSGDGNTLCVTKSNSRTTFLGQTIFTYEKVEDLWTKTQFDHLNSYDSGGDISLSFDGKYLATSETNSFSNQIMHNKVRIYAKTKLGWIQKGIEINLFGSLFTPWWKRLQTIKFSKNPNVILISGIGEEFNFDENNVHVQLYEFEDNFWKPKGNIVKGYHPRDGFGFSTNLSDDGNRFAISAIGVDFDDYNFNGIVKVYDYVEPEWILKQDTIVGENNWDICGYATALSGDGTKLYVSCPFYSEDYFRAGKIGIYDLSPYTSTTIAIKSPSNYTITPNPTSGLIQINEALGKDVIVYNQVGIQVLRVDLQGVSKTLELDLGHLENGIYFVRIDEGDVRKVVLLKE